jgi:HAD superfamily hydrolase (TIGR01549 family)
VKNNINHYCFDLDGTLVDSNQTIYKATEYALNELGIKFNISPNDFVLKIGQHFNDIFDSFNINVTDFEEFIDIYKENYFDQIKYSKLYNFVEETLIELKNQNTKISLLTTKGQDQATKIINYFDLGRYFDLVMGRRDGIAHKPSAEPLLMICDELNVDVTKTLMVGDTELDIQCGKNAGTKTCGIVHGYRTKELLEFEKPDFIISSINEILNLKNNS